MSDRLAGLEAHVQRLEELQARQRESSLSDGEKRELLALLQMRAGLQRMPGPA